MSDLAPVPLRVMLTNGKTWLVESLWARWFLSLLERINAVPVIQASVSLTAQGAAVATTDLDASIEGGLYRVTYALNVTRAATTSSSFTTTIGWTTNGVSCSSVGAAVTGNTTSTHQGGTVVLNADADTLVTIDQSERFIAKAEELGCKVRFETRPGKGHGWPTMFLDIVRFADWFDEHLKPQ